MVRRRARELGVDCSRFTGEGWRRGRRGALSRSRPLEEYLVVNSSATSSSWIKSRLIGSGLLTNRCAVCDLGPEWRGEPLTLVLDHVNGVNDDYRLENLPLLCRNCNSQTATFAGRNKGKRRREGGAGGGVVRERPWAPYRVVAPARSP